jgi:hypothetical protein
VRLTGCQRQPHRKPIGIDDRVNLTGQPAPWPAHRLSSVLSNAGTVLMHADDRGVDHLHGSVMGASQGVHDLAPDARSSPAKEASPSACRGQPQVRFRGEADMNRPARLAGSVENDPKRTFITKTNSSRRLAKATQ